MESTGRFVPSSSATLRSCSTLSRVLIGQQIVDLVVGLPGGARAGRRRLALAVLAGPADPARAGERGDTDAELAAGAHDLMLDVTVV